MNTFGLHWTCQVCGFELFAAWERARRREDIARLQRELDNGMCDSCQRLRQGAAVEYEHAAQEVRLLSTFAPEVDDRYGRTPSGRFRGGRITPLAHALNRMEMASARCVELKMWPAMRDPRGRETT